MLVIREAQMQAFRDALEADFLIRIEAALRREFPDTIAAMSPDDRHAFIRDGRKKAEGYSIVTEWDICRFLLYQLRMGCDFDNRSDMAWAGRILNDDRSNKMDRLDDFYFHGK